MYLIKKNCANEYFNIYKYAFENIEKSFEFLKLKYVYSVSIKQIDKFKFSTIESTTTKKKKIFLLYNIANNTPYFVLIFKLNTQILFKKSKLKRIQSNEQQQQSTFDKKL